MEQLLNEYVANFFGYGDVYAPIWFVGPEERSKGADKPAIQESLEHRLQAYAVRRRGLEDCRSWCRALGINTWHEENPPIQPTWGKLIRVAWQRFCNYREQRQGIIEGIGHGEERMPLGFDEEARSIIRSTQRDYWGSALVPENHGTGLLCDISVLPFPSPTEKNADWPYAGFHQIEWLETRPRCRNHILLARIASLRKLIAMFRPKLVVFYGSHPDWWQQIAGGEFDNVECLNGVSTYSVEGTLFVIMPHPNHHGITNQYFNDIADLLKYSPIQ